MIALNETPTRINSLFQAYRVKITRDIAFPFSREANTTPYPKTVVTRHKIRDVYCGTSRVDNFTSCKEVMSWGNVPAHR